MKICPVRQYPKPAYPAQEQARRKPELLKNIPARWDKAPGFAALLGVLSLGSVRAEVAEEVSSLPALDPEAAAGKRETAPAVQKAGAMVAPMLDEALANDGRGSFGCMAISPPSFLAEDEALELIRSELEAAGLQLRDDAILEGMTAPTRPEDQQISTNEDGTVCISSGLGNPNVLGPRPVRFDWADPERGVYIEFLTRRDYREWDGLSRSTADSYDFSELAQKVAAAYGKYPAERRAVFGVFFDPLAHDGVVGVPVTGLPPEEARLADAEYKRAAAAAKDARGFDKLRRQVRHFVEFLEKEGVVGAPK